MTNKETNEDQNGHLVDMFSSLSNLFKQMSSTSIIPKECIENESIDQVEAKTDKKIPNKNVKKKESTKYKDIPFINIVEDDNKSYSESISKELSSDFDYSNKLRNSFSSQMYHSNIINNKHKHNKREVFFIQEEGWMVNFKVGDISFNLGPFISKRKAYIILNFIKFSSSVMKKMNGRERKQWGNEGSCFIEEIAS